MEKLVRELFSFYILKISLILEVDFRNNQFLFNVLDDNFFILSSNSYTLTWINLRLIQVVLGYAIRIVGLDRKTFELVELLQKILTGGSREAAKMMLLCYVGQ